MKTVASKVSERAVPKLLIQANKAPDRRSKNEDKTQR